MAKHKRVTREKHEKVGHKYPVRQHDSKPQIDRSNEKEYESLSITKTPYYPQMDEHNALLSSISSSEQRHGFMMKLHQTYGNKYVQRLVELVQAEAKLNISTPKDLEVGTNLAPAKQPPPVPTYKPWKQEEKASEEKKVEEPYEYKPLEGMDRTIYEQALLKFKQMKKPRILGGVTKSVRRLEALKYLKETVQQSKVYTRHTQMVINSIMEAYKEVFGEELTEEKAPERLGTEGQEKVSRWQKFKIFVSSIFSIKKWISWIKDFIEFCKDPAKAVEDKAGITLPGFLSFAQPIADQVAKWTQWLPIVGIVTSIVSMINGIRNTLSKFKDMLALRSAAKEAKKKQVKDTASEELQEAAQYGYAKVRRGFFSRLYNMIKSAANLVLSVAKLVVGMFSGGIGAIIVQAADLALTLVDLAVTAARKIKGFAKWILGIRGKARRENAEKIVMAARDGSDEAIDLILKLDPSGIVRGGKLDKSWYWLKYWGAKKTAHSKEMLKQILKDWDKKEIDTLVKGVAEKLKSQ